MLEDKVHEITAYVEKELRGRPMTEETAVTSEEVNSSEEETVSNATMPPKQKATSKPKMSGAIKSRA